MYDNMELSRRAALGSVLTGVAAAGLVAARGADAGSPRSSLPRTTDAALHAARRLTFGATPAVVARIRDLGLAAWLDEQLAATPDVNGLVAALGHTSAPLPPSALMKLDRELVADLQSATFARAAWADHQLQEVLVEFFTNHLSIAAYSDQVGRLKLADDRDVVRAHVLGTFSDMAVASLQSPAMLRYLSNATSRAPIPNENYARELLELHTVGVGVRYSQRDVNDAARTLTGLSVDENGAFVYRPAWHHTGPVRVLGWSHANADPAQGVEVATSLARYLALHPATAKRLATKLVRRFVSDTPPAALVSSAAKVYLAHGSAIVPTVRHILLSGAFAQSADRKTQRPFEWAAAAVRLLGLQQDDSMHANGAPVVWMLQGLGQAPFEWPLPDGYPDDASDWATTASMLARWNAVQALVSGQVKGIKALDADALVGTPVPTTVGGLADRLAVRLLTHKPRSALQAALVRFTGKASAAPLDQAAVRALTPGLAALVLSSPEAQLR